MLFPVPGSTTGGLTALLGFPVVLEGPATLEDDVDAVFCIVRRQRCPEREREQRTRDAETRVARYKFLCPVTNRRQ